MQHTSMLKDFPVSTGRARDFFYGFAMAASSTSVQALYAEKVWELPEWAALKDHAEKDIKGTHLKELMEVRHRSIPHSPTRL